jgi:hypothetical protein
MAYQLIAPLVLVKLPRREGGETIVYHYLATNPYIPWLNDQQREQFLKEGLVEEIPEIESAVEAIDGLDPITDCIAALDQLDVPTAAGAPKARDALRGAGHRFSNDVIAAAVKARKSPRPIVPDSAELASA